MNWLRRTHPVAPEPPSIHESHKDMQTVSRTTTTGEIFNSEDPFTKFSSSEGSEKDNGVDGALDTLDEVAYMKSQVCVGRYSDVTEEEGWITIPFKEPPEDWSTASNIGSFCSLDRSFVFPGEQLHILACLAASKQDTEVITPFKVAALMSKNSSHSHLGSLETASNSISLDTDINSENQAWPTESININGETAATSGRLSAEIDISATESLIRMEDHRHQTEVLLEKFNHSHFYVRIAEFDEPLWSRRTISEENNASSVKPSIRDHLVNAVIDRGKFDGYASGGAARNTVRCCSLHNGDIVVLLEVNVGIASLKDPVLEVFQFEQHPYSITLQNSKSVTAPEDPCGELLRWLLPLDRAVPPPERPSSPPVGSATGVGSASQRSISLASSSSQLLSHGHFRSYSMSSLPQASLLSSSVTLPSNTKVNFDIEESNHFEDNSTKIQELGAGGCLSFRGVQLELEQYSVQCGLGGIYLPGKRWRKKLEIIQPIEIQSFSVHCNTEDLLCVQLKNVSPDKIPDLIIYVDAISIIFEELPQNGHPMSLPLSSIEAGNGYSLPNLLLRRGEEHSFILKPASLTVMDLKNSDDRAFHLPQSHVGTSGTNKLSIPNMGDRKNTVVANQYAVLVSFRCNYTESKLFFKKPTSWKPHTQRDVLISVAPEVSRHDHGTEQGIHQLPVQALTLQATNLTNEDLTLTVLTPASITASPSVVSMNSAPATPVSPYAGFPELMERTTKEKYGIINMQRISSMPTPGCQKDSSNSGQRSVSLVERTTRSPHVIPNSELDCTHLWLQSVVPLGCVPAQSSTKVKLELLPLTDGIISLDTLQVAAKEKGLTYVPEYSLKIHATSSVTTDIL